MASQKVKSATNEKKAPAQSPKGKPRPKKSSYLDFLLTEELPEEDIYDSDEDPSFLPSAHFDPDLDYDEYSDGEVPDEEHKLLMKEMDEELKVDELKKALEKIAEEDETEEQQSGKNKEDANDEKNEDVETSKDKVSDEAEKTDAKDEDKGKDKVEPAANAEKP